MKFRKRYLVLLAAPALLGMLMIVHTAGAATSGSPVVQRFETILQGLVERGTISQEQAQAVLDEAKPLLQDLAPRQGHQNRGLNPKMFIAATVETLGLERDAVISQIKEGSTLAEVIEANGATVDAVIDFMAQRIAEKLDQAVADGKISADQATEKLASFRERAASFLTGHRFDGAGYQGGRSHRSAGPKIARGVIGATAQVLGLEVSAVVEELKTGETLAGILAENGESTDAVIDQVTARVEEKLAEAVEAGRVTQEKADAHLAKIQDAATALLNKEGLLNALTHGRHHRLHAGRLIAGVAGILEVPRAELVEALMGGTPIAEFAASLGIDATTIVDELTAARAERLSNAVEQGRVTAGQADEMIERMRAAVERFLQHVPNQA